MSRSYYYQEYKKITGKSSANGVSYPSGTYDFWLNQWNQATLKEHRQEKKFIPQRKEALEDRKYNRNVTQRKKASVAKRAQSKKDKERARVVTNRRNAIRDKRVMNEGKQYMKAKAAENAMKNKRGIVREKKQVKKSIQSRKCVCKPKKK